MALQLPHLGPRARKIVRYVGFALLALVTFVFAFQMTFPFHRVKDKVVELLQDKYDVTIGDVERGFIPGRMYFKAVTLRTRPTKDDDVATTFYIERLEVGIGLFALLRGTASVKIDAKIGSGHIDGTIALSKDGTSIDIAGDDLPSASLPVREALGLPMSGKVRFAFELDLPNEKSKAGRVGANWTKAVGRAELACPSGCTVGDGKAKLKAKLKNRAQQAFAEGGIDFGKVNIDTLLATVAIKNGKLTVTKFDAKSGDGELHVDFDMTLNQDLNSSTVAGCLRFKGSDGLLKREAKTHAAISTTGAPLGPDNLFHIKLDGPLREVRRIGVVCSGGGAAAPSPDNAAGVPARPNLTVTPEAPARPGIPAAQPLAPAVTPSPAIPPPLPPPAAALPGSAAGSADAGFVPPAHVPPPFPESETLPAGSAATGTVIQPATPGAPQ